MTNGILEGFTIVYSLRGYVNTSSAAGFEDILSFFSSSNDPLGWMGPFQDCSEMFNWVQVRTLAAALTDLETLRLYVMGGPGSPERVLSNHLS